MPCGPINRLDQVFADPQVQARGMTLDLPHPLAGSAAGAHAAALSGTPPGLRAAAAAWPALGVGGLAVALALQDTLSNLFGGFYMTVAGQIRLGDYIRLNSGEEGFITDISWRSTTIRGLNNNLIIIPNASMAKAIITNYNLPEKRMIVTIPVGVDYSCDPDQVEAVLLDIAARATVEVPGILAEPVPVVRFAPGFGDSALQFSLTIYVTEFSEQFRIQHELRKRILKRFRAEKIEMPFPTRTVFLYKTVGLLLCHAVRYRPTMNPHAKSSWRLLTSLCSWRHAVCGNRRIWRPLRTSLCIRRCLFLRSADCARLPQDRGKDLDSQLDNLSPKGITGTAEPLFRVQPASRKIEKDQAVA